MMPGHSFPSLGAICIALGLSGCSNDYFERKDSVSLNAGDAVAWNSAQMIVDPTPRHAFNTNIVTSGETAARAGRNYATGQTKWYVSPGQRDDPKEEMIKAGASDPDTAPRKSGGAAGGAASVDNLAGALVGRPQ